MPTNTNVMKYNKLYHRYVLNKEWLKETYDIDFISIEGSEKKADNRMLQISNRIYNFIYNHKQRSKKYWEWFLAFDEEVRHVLKEALIQQAIFESESSASMLQNQIGINPLNGIVNSQNELKGTRGIALEAENTLRFFKDGMLLYGGKQMYLPEDTVFSYEELGY